VFEFKTTVLKFDYLEYIDNGARSHRCWFIKKVTWKR